MSHPPYQSGAMVKVLDGPQTVRRRVVYDRGKIVYVCHEDEWRKARWYGKNPMGEIFARKYISSY